MEDTKELITTDDIRSKVYIIRGQQVMLDKDLAEIYGYEVKRLNEQVKRNISRFPEDFMFQLNREEIPEGFSKSQFATLNEKSNRQGYCDYNEYEIAGEYEDAGKSGKSIEGRIAFNQMMDDIKSGKDRQGVLKVYLKESKKQKCKLIIS
ncbi:ORF6N domain-containing protein [Waltera sp.]|uniref:ORF6N domain-containing protein n=1 Tax=Waltera sp. TaxID=2815806 RepID=UPI003204A7BA